MRRVMLFFFLLTLLLPVHAFADSKVAGSGGPANALGSMGQPSVAHPMAKSRQPGQTSKDGEVSKNVPPAFANGLYMSRCMEFTRKKDFKGAVEACSKAIELDPDNSYAYNLRSAALSELGYIDEAIQDCQTAARFGDEECKKWLKEVADWERENVLRLRCSVAFNKEAPQDYAVRVDLAYGAVNGAKARITNDTIYWTVGKDRAEAWFEISRYTGVLRGGNTDDGATYYGKCVKAEEKKF